jgi:hypothetical protein
MFLDDLRHTCPGSTTPVEPLKQASGTMSLRLASPVLPSTLADASASTTSFFRDPIPRPACSLSTLRSQSHLCTTQDSLLAGGLTLARRESNPLGRYVRFAFTCWRSHDFLLTEASWRTAR